MMKVNLGVRTNFVNILGIPSLGYKNASKISFGITDCLIDY